MARKGENIYQRKDGRYEARYIAGRDDDGKAIYKAVYAHGYKEVKEKRTAALEELEKQRNSLPKAGTAAAVCTDWLAANEKTWKESTYSRYQEKVRRRK